jgi:hypothetical protein
MPKPKQREIDRTKVYEIVEDLPDLPGKWKPVLFKVFESAPKGKLLKINAEIIDTEQKTIYSGLKQMRARQKFKGNVTQRNGQLFVWLE